MTFKEKAWYFFEESNSKPAKSFRYFIVFLILLSVSMVIVDITKPGLLASLDKEVFYLDYFILIVFTIEYVLRFIFSPKKTKFLFDKYNIIDFIAVAPFYLGLANPAALRTLKIFRLLRLARLFRLLRLFNAFKFKGTILQKVTPLVLLLVAVKVTLMYLESIGYWFVFNEIGVLFTIIGFALGVVLSSKIATTYGKYLSIEDTLFKMQGRLSSMVFNLNSSGGDGAKVIRKWSLGFIEIYNDADEGSMRKVMKLNSELYDSVRELGNSDLIPHHRLAALLKEIFVDASFILGRKTTYVPEAYDRILQQVLLIYLFLIAIFIPGVEGMLGAVLGTYLLYGLYYVTIDLDLSNKDVSLIDLEPKRLELFAEELGKQKNN
jgi:hypothetical protein